MATKSRKGTVHAGTLQSVIRSGDEWLAVVVRLTAGPGVPVWSSIVPIGQLKGSARKKADRWLEYLQ